MNISITCLADDRLEDAAHYAAQVGVPLSSRVMPEADYVLVFDEDDVHLLFYSDQEKQAKRRKPVMVRVDFCSGAAAHRRRFGGGKGQMIAKAVGLKTGFTPAVFDMTAGLGGDAFVLASLGCDVTLFERNPVVHALLADGLRRAHEFAVAQDEGLREVVERMRLMPENSIDWLRRTERKPSVIYLDPMFPERKKSASVKKEMQAFHGLVGDDADSDALLQLALRVAEHRVVVKRPRIAPVLGGREPAFTLEGKSSRFDIYALKSLNK